MIYFFSFHVVLHSMLTNYWTGVLLLKLKRTKVRCTTVYELWICKGLQWNEKMFTHRSLTMSSNKAIGMSNQEMFWIFVLTALISDQSSKRRQFLDALSGFKQFYEMSARFASTFTVTGSTHVLNWIHWILNEKKMQILRYIICGPNYHKSCSLSRWSG